MNHYLDMVNKQTVILFVISGIQMLESRVVKVVEKIRIRINNLELGIPGTSSLVG